MSINVQAGGSSGSRNYSHSRMPRLGRVAYLRPKPSKTQQTSNPGGDNSGHTDGTTPATAPSAAMRFVNGVRKAVTGNSGVNEDGDSEDFDWVRVRYVPQSVESICRLTSFSKEEVRLIYRDFKQDCPTGIITVEKFKDIYNRFFPLADAREYATFVFSSLDCDGDGSLTFEQFIVAMSLLSRGSTEQKLRWIFKLYDLNGDGFIDDEELAVMIASIQNMIGRNTRPIMENTTVTKEARRLIEKFDLDGDGRISFNEFYDVSSKDQTMLRSLQGCFDTVL